jgi:hypothetical protein
VIDAVPGDLCSVRGLVAFTDPVNIVVGVCGSVMLDPEHRVPWFVVSSAGAVNNISTFDYSERV